MNRMLRITTFLAALVALAIAAPLAQADPPQLEQHATNSAKSVPLDGWAPFALSGGYDAKVAVARDGHLPSSADSQLPNFNIYGSTYAVTDGPVPLAGPAPWVGQYYASGDAPAAFDIYGRDLVQTSVRDGHIPSTPQDTTVQTRAPQSGSDIKWSDAGYGFGAGLLLAVLIGGAVVMSGRAGRGLAHS
jgi:hypothetical protein